MRPVNGQQPSDIEQSYLMRSTNMIGQKEKWRAMPARYADSKDRKIWAIRIRNLRVNTKAMFVSRLVKHSNSHKHSLICWCFNALFTSIIFRQHFTMVLMSSASQTMNPDISQVVREDPISHLSEVHVISTRFISISNSRLHWGEHSTRLSSIYHTRDAPYYLRGSALGVWYHLNRWRSWRRTITATGND